MSSSSNSGISFNLSASSFFFSLNPLVSERLSMTSPIKFHAKFDSSSTSSYSGRSKSSSESSSKSKSLSIVWVPISAITGGNSISTGLGGLLSAYQLSSKGCLRVFLYSSIASEKIGFSTSCKSSTLIGKLILL